MLAHQPHHVATHLTLGNELTRAGEFDPAEIHIRAAISTDPDNFRARVLLADFLDYRGRSSEALAEYERARELDPDAEKPHIGVVMNLIRLRRVDEALVALGRGLEAVPRSERLLEIRGRLLEALEGSNPGGPGP